MNEWTPAALKRQFDAAKQNGWLPFFEDAAKQYDLPVNILIAIGSRETNLKNIIGDKGHGFGVMQIDKRYYPEWCASGKWRDAKEGIRMGAFVLRSFRNSAEKWLPGNYDRARAAIAAYNCGRRAFMNYLAHSNPDIGTTGHDYSKDVLARAAVFQQLLEADQKVA